MRVPKQLVDWGEFAVSLLAAIFILTLVFGLPGAMRQAVGEGLTVGRALFVTVAVVLAAALLLFAGGRCYLNLTASNRGRYLLFETPSGRVHIKARSVEAVINRAVRCMDEVADARASLVLPKGAHVPTGVRVRCRLYERPNILAIQDQIRALVSDRYLEMFPSEDPMPVEVAIEGIAFETPGPKVPPKPQPKRTKKEEEEDAEAHPFRAQYPVGD